MATISIMLETSSPAFKTLQRELHEYLASLDTVKFRTETTPAESGTLGGEEDVFKYIVENATAIISFLAAVMTLVAQAKSSSESKSKKTSKDKDEKPVIVEVNGKRISLPASESTRKKFLKIIENDLKSNTSKKKTKR